MRFRFTGLLSLVAFLIGLSPSLSSTTLVGIWTKKQITIAADSKQTETDLDGRIVGSQTGCKVYQVRNIIIAYAGLAAGEGVNVVEAIRKSRELTDQTGRKLPEESLDVAAEQAVVQILKNRNTPSDPNVSIDLLIAGDIGGKLQMIRLEMSGMSTQGQFSMANKTLRIAYPESAGYNDSNRGIEVVGVKRAIDRYKATSPDWSKGDDATVASDLIKIEANDAADSALVGAPISVVEINKKRIRWIDKGACQ